MRSSVTKNDKATPQLGTLPNAYPTFGNFTYIRPTTQQGLQYFGNTPTGNG